MLRPRLAASPNNKRLIKLAELAHKEFTLQVEKEKQADKTYLKLCRGESTQDPIIFAQLKCRYLMKNSAFLRIAPIKAEELNLKPYVVLFHDVIYDEEIEEIKQMAKPKVIAAHFAGILSNKDFYYACSLNDQLFEIISAERQ